MTAWTICTVICRKTVVVVACLSCGAARTEVVRSDDIPQALRGVPAAAQVCRVNDAVAAAASSKSTTMPVPATAAAAGCTLVTSNTAAILQTGAAVLIDVRPLADYQAFHINGALNASLSEVHTKSYWRDASIVLIGNGKAEGELMAQCADLRQAGYRQLHVLRGGMPAWLGSGRPVLGSAPTIGQQTRLSAVDYLVESRNADNVLLPDNTPTALGWGVPAAVDLPTDTPGAIAALLAMRGTAVRRRGAVVLAASRSVSNAQIAALQRAVLPLPLLVYADGREALVSQLKVEQQVWAAYNRGPRQPGCGL